MYKHVQRSFNGGQLDHRLMGRQDLAKYFNGASAMQNILSRRHGNASKRRGTDLACDLANLLGGDFNNLEYTPRQIRKARLFPLPFDRETGYAILMTARKAFLCRRDGVRAVRHRWLQTIDQYDASQDYAGKALSSADYPFMIGSDGFNTLGEAFAAAEDGDVIVATGDEEIILDSTATLSTAGISVTLDLNGRHLVSTVTTEPSSTPVDAVAITGAGTTLTIRDSGTGGMLTMADQQVAHLVGVRGSGAKLVLESGSLVANAPMIEYTSDGSTTQAWRGTIVLVGNAAFEGHGGIVANDGGSMTWLEPDPEDPDDEGRWIPDKAAALFVFGGTVQASVQISGGLYRGKNFDTYGGNPSAMAVLAGWQPGVSTSIGGATFTISGGTFACYMMGGTPATNGGISGPESHSPALTVTGGAFLSLNSVPDGSIVRAEFQVDDPADWDEISEDDTTFPPGTVLNTTPRGPFSFYEEQETYAVGVHPPGEGDYTAPSPAWSDLDEDYLSSGEGVAATDLPYYIDIPWADEDLAELDFTQSGDTMFFAHGEYPPAKIVFNPASHTLAYGTLNIGRAAWKRPVITNVDMSGMDKEDVQVTAGNTTHDYTVTKTTYQGATKKTVVASGSASTNVHTVERPPRKIAYAVSYVKDGVESPLSIPMEVTYYLPWQEGWQIAISFSKGANSTEPDCYNIYKRQDSDFGLIGSVKNMNSATLSPSVSALGTNTTLVRLTNGSFNGDAFSDTATTDILRRAPTSFSTGRALERESSAGPATVWAGVGGVKFPNGMKVSFGSSSGVGLARVDVYLDAHMPAYADAQDGSVSLVDRIAVSGTKITCKMTYSPKSGGSSSTATKTVTLQPIKYRPVGQSALQSAASGTVEHDCGTLPRDMTLQEAIDAVKRKPRVASFTFSGQGSKQVSKLEITAKNGNTSVPLVVSGVTFKPANSIDHLFADNYITPDMSITPLEPDSPTFNTAGDYPSCIGLYQQRLMLAGTKNDPFAFHMSAVGDLYSFATHASMREDDAINASIAATEFPDPNHIVVGRDILLLAEGGEWKIGPVSGNALTYKTFSAKLQSRIGSVRRVRPLMIGDMVVFADGSGQTLNAIRYSYASDGYESTDLTVLSADMFDCNPIVQTAYQQYPDSRIFCVLEDGSMAVLVYMPEHEVASWSRFVAGGGWKMMGVASVKSISGNTEDLLMLAERDGAWALWRWREELPDMTVSARVSMDAVRTMTGAAAYAAWRTGWIAVDPDTAVTYGSAAELAAADGYATRTYIVGWPFAAELSTVRPEPQGQGTIQFELKNAKDVEVRVVESGGWRAGAYGLADHPVYAQRVDAVPTAEDGAIALDSSDHKLLLSGDNGGDGRVQIRSDAPFPLEILYLAADYEIQPLSDSEG